MNLYELYERRLFPKILDFTMKPLERYRADVIAPAHGQVLEIGFGTGLNLPHYPCAVQRLTAVDPIPPTHKKTRGRVESAPFPVDHHALRADGGLPFEDDRFDTITVTWTLCTIPDPTAALREMHRVARPHARLLFIEHGQSNDPSVARWQDRLNPLQKFFGCGCNLNRRIDQLIEAAGYRIETLDRFDAEDIPKTHGHLYRGVAVS